MELVITLIDYDVTYGVDSSRDIGKIYTSQKIQAYINTLDVANDGYSTDQIENYIDPSNTSNSTSNNTEIAFSLIKSLISLSSKAFPPIDKTCG